MGNGQHHLKNISHLKLPELFESDSYGCDAVGRRQSV